MSCAKLYRQSYFSVTSCSFCKQIAYYSEQQKLHQVVHCSAPSLNLFNQVRYAGHSKWSNIKFKKMNKDNARAKVFGKLSLEIIQAVKENGADIAQNSKLESLVMKAKASSMPKEKIEMSIKNALRNTDAIRSKVLLQARGPGKCGLLIDALTPNAARTKHELKNILKKNESTYIEDGSVAFMFKHKGVISIANSFNMVEEDVKEKAEEVAIMIGAEDVFFQNSEEENEAQKSIQFICPPLDVLQLKKNLANGFSDLRILSADVHYLADTLVSITDEQIDQSDRLIELITEHPDVLQVFDNIIGYPSRTMKLTNQFS